MNMLKGSAGILLMCGLFGCNQGTFNPETSRSGIKVADVSVEVGSDGLTTEQRNIKARIKNDNKPGSIKHLYVLSSFTGDCIIYSTVKGKVTSSGKRLIPYTKLVELRNGNGGSSGVVMETIQDDGTYGSSSEYLYWFSEEGNYHQHYVMGGQILHISDQPLPIKKITIDFRNVK